MPQVNKPQAINVIMYINDGENDIAFDLNKEGLYRMTFDRYADANNDASGILTSMDITLIDITGNQLISKLQKNDYNLRVRYGFDNIMSPVYTLNILGINSNFNNAGMTLSLGAIGRQLSQDFPAEVYKIGVKLSDILYTMAKRNNWYADETTIDCDLRIDKPLLKESGETDIDFIMNKLRPIATRSVVPESISASNTSFWDVKLYDNGSQFELHFKPTGRTIGRRVWKYEYNMNGDSHVLDINNRLNYSYTLSGLTIQVSSDDLEANTMGSDKEASEYLTKKIYDLSDEIDKVFQKYNLPMFSTNNFKFKADLVRAEDIGNKTLNQRILEAVDKAVMSINTMEMVVIGNPNIRPTDLIDLIVKNRDGSINVLTSPTNISSYWRVIGIKETIGTDGYKTHLKLVREVVNL